MLVMSGSDRDKLLRLVNTGAAPFYGSQIQRMPVLNADFIRHVTGLIEKQRPDLRPVDWSALLEAFNLFGARPQFFMEALGQVLSPLSGLSSRPEPAMLKAAHAQQMQDQAQMASDYLGLKPVEQAVLWRLLEQEGRFRPYDAEGLKFYSGVVGKRVTVAQAQSALAALREREPPLVWKSAHGEYAAEDTAMHQWFEQLVAHKLWPPSSSTTK
jgi:hypothetical protein